MDACPSKRGVRLSALAAGAVDVPSPEAGVYLPGSGTSRATASRAAKMPRLWRRRIAAGSASATEAAQEKGSARVDGATVALPRLSQ